MNRPVPQVGDPAPDFTLAAGNGPPVTLSALRPERHTVLYFVREYT